VKDKKWLYPFRLCCLMVRFIFEGGMLNRNEVQKLFWVILPMKTSLTFLASAHNSCSKECFKIGSMANLLFLVVRWCWLEGRLRITVRAQWSSDSVATVEVYMLKGWAEVTPFPRSIFIPQIYNFIITCRYEVTEGVMALVDLPPGAIKNRNPKIFTKLIMINSFKF
jgi:hypothetical protein